MANRRWTWSAEEWLFPYFGHASIWNTEYWFLVFIQKHWTEFKRLSNHHCVSAAPMHYSNEHTQRHQGTDMDITFTVNSQWFGNLFCVFFLHECGHTLQRNFNKLLWNKWFEICWKGIVFNKVQGIFFGTKREKKGCLYLFNHLVFFLAQ